MCAHVADDKKAEDIVVLSVGELVPITDYFVIATVQNGRQMRAVTDEIRQRLKVFGRGAPHAEGEGGERWQLLDYGSVVVHLFDRESRGYYDLDSLWADAAKIAWRDEAMTMSG
ncbi:MAG: ribosome silencing factor [Planctomycetota bacterium]